MNNVEKNIYKGDKKIAFALVSQFWLQAGNYVLKEVLNINDSSLRQVISLIFMTVIMLMFLRAIKSVIKRAGHQCAIAYLIGFIGFSIAYLYEVKIEDLIEPAMYFFLLCLPNFLLYYSLVDKNIFVKRLVACRYVLFAIILIYYLCFKLLGITFEYDMVFSYHALVPCLLCIYNFNKKHKYIDILVAIVITFLVIFIGSRGPLLCIMVYIVMYYIINSVKGNKKLKSKIVVFCGITFGVILLFNFDFFINCVIQLFDKYNIESRTIYSLKEITEIEFFSGRIEIYKNAINNIVLNPILGVGICGDRQILNGTYPHNIFIEILMHYGIVLGFVFIAFIIYLSVKTLFNKNTVNRDIGLIFFSLGFVPLLVSGTYLSSYNFWIFLSICYSSSFKKIKYFHGNEIELKYI